MKRILEKYLDHHQASSFCELGTLRNILAYHGHSLSVSMLFGIANAFGFGYSRGNTALVPDNSLPFPVASPFTPFPLTSACRALNIWRHGGRSLDEARTWQEIRRCINEGTPSVVEVEMNSYFSFMKIPLGIPGIKQGGLRIGGHVVAVVGYDDEADLVYVQEALLRNPSAIPRAAFAAMRSVFDCAVAPENEWNVYYPAPDLAPLGELIHSGIANTVQRMRHPFRTIEAGISFGLPGLDSFFAEMPQWRKTLGETQFAYSLFVFYNFSEMMYRNGGLLRAFFALFLEEAATSLGDGRLVPIAALYRELAVSWKALTARMIADAPRPDQGIHVAEDADYRALCSTIRSQEHQGVEILETWLGR